MNDAAGDSGIPGDTKVDVIGAALDEVAGEIGALEVVDDFTDVGIRIRSRSRSPNVCLSPSHDDATFAAVPSSRSPSGAEIPYAR